MAIQTDIILNNGISLPNAYIRVTSILYVVDTPLIRNNGRVQHMDVTVSIYKDQSSRIDRKHPIRQNKYIIPVDITNNQNNIIKQAYAWLKLNVEDFKDSKDI